MGFPSKKEIRRILKKLEHVEGTLHLSDSASPLEVFRWKIHQKFVNYRHEENLTQKELAVMVGIDEAKMSKILHHRLDGFSTDRLITLYEKINPRLKLEVS